MNRKKIYALLSLVFVYCLSFSQNINYQVEVIALRCSIASDGIFGGPDPTWKVWANDDTDPIWTGGQCVFRNDVSLITYTLDTLDPSGELPYIIRSISNSSATQINLRFEGFEKDCAFFGITDRCTFDGCCDMPFCFLADEFLCQTNSLGTIQFQNEPQCQWNYYDWFNCGVFDVKVRVRWEYSTPPQILVQPTVLTYDTTICVPAPLNLSVTGDTSVSSYQWQISSNTSLNPISGWTDIAGANSSTFAVPIINGTRNYRAIVSSDCIPGFYTGATFSESVRVTYQPYPSSPIVSPLCGSMVLPYSTHNFSVIQPPDSNAIVNSSFLWSGTQGLNIHTPNASSTDISFPSYGLYQISVEYIDNCTGQNTASPLCQIIVGSSHCDYVYVSPTGTDTSIAGTPDEPVKTLAYALTMATGSRNTIRLQGGIYNETSVINLKDELTIDGGYAVDSNDIWTKNSSETTVINVDAPLETAFLDTAHVGFFRGFVANNVSDWTLQDLHINVKPDGATGTTERNGHSVYGVHIIGNSQNYLISRCHISTGAASNGEDGQVGLNGIDGNDGGLGLAGGQPDNGYFDCDFDANGHGGTGATAVGSGQNLGGAGGNGGRGEYNQFDAYAAGEDGQDGHNGAVGNTQGGSAYGNGGERFTNCIPGSGSIGENGMDGQDGISYLVPAISNMNFDNDFWINPYGANGGDGFGGGGGQGGGGSSGQGTGLVPFCLPGRGNGGGGGGSGGQGGFGGQGGGGGGAAIAIYASGNSSGMITSSEITLPPAPPAQGGMGNYGGIGGNGGYGGVGDTTCMIENGAGGNGGNGGYGGNGGKGQDGAQGIITAIAIGSNALINGAGSSIPHPTIISVNYNNFRGCTYSELEITKEQGQWTLPAQAHYVNNIDSITSAFDNTSDTALIYFDNTGVYDMGANSGIFETFIRITDDRLQAEIIINSSPACFDSTIYLSADLLALEYDWTVYSTNPFTEVFTSNHSHPEVNGLPEGTYVVKLRQRDVCCGWSIPVYKPLVVWPELNAGVIGNDTIVCYGNAPDSIYNILLASGSSGSNYNYQWQMSYNSNVPDSGLWQDISGANNPTLVPNNLSDTAYFVRKLIHDCGILYSNVVTVIVLPELLGGIIESDTILCEGSMPSVFGSLEGASGGFGNYSYQWHYSTTTNIPGGTGWQALSGANSPHYQAGMLSQTTHFVREVVDSCGSAFSNVITVTVDSMPSVDAGQALELCGVLVFDLDGVISHGNANWSQTAGVGSSTFLPDNQSLNPNVSVTHFGNYTYTLTVTYGTCTDSSSVDVVLHPNLQLTVSPNDTTICIGTSINLSVSGGDNYVWQPADFLTATTGSSVTATPTSTIQYTVSATDSHGCTGTESIIINIDAMPIIDAGSPQELCGILSFQLSGTTDAGNGAWHLSSGSGNVTYSPSNTSSAPHVTASNYGTYNFAWVVNSGTCADSANTTVILHPLPQISLIPQSAGICEGDNITITAGGADTYMWQPSTYLSSSVGDVVTATPLSDINYTVTGTANTGCSSTANVSITVHAFPLINLGDSIYICAEPLIILDAGAGYQNYLWSTGSTETQIQVSQAGIYTVIVDNHGCISTDTILVLPCIDVSVPNVFTPNGDGINDFFYAEGNFLKSFQMTVFNRWGKKVFETFDIEQAWDGTYKGTDATEGTYFWVIVYQSMHYELKNEVIELKGWVQLVR